MKKIVAFLMAFALSVMCFGTYGFADLTSDDTHAHDHAPSQHVVSAATVNDLFINTETSTYEKSYGELVMNLRLGPRKLNYRLDGTITITIEAKEGVLNTSATSVRGSFYGSNSTTPTYTATTVTLKFPVYANTNADAGSVRVVIPLSSTYTDTAANREVIVKLDYNGTGAILNKYADTYRVSICEHEMEEELVPATCQEDGYSEDVCVICGYRDYNSYELIRTTGEEHVYDFSDPLPPLSEYKESCDKTEGKGWFKCTLCGILKKKVGVQTAPHDFYKRELGSDGKWYSVCRDCGARVVSDNQCSHSTYNYIKISEKVPATCQSTGIAIWRCPTCGHDEERTIPRLTTHTYGGWQVVTAATCKQEGLQKRTCTVCGDVDTNTIPKSEHPYGEWTLLYAGSCTTPGKRQRVCSACYQIQQEDIAGSGHSWGPWAVTIPASCNVMGTNTRTCSNCGETDTKRTDMIPHSYGAWVTVTPATCVATGTDSHTCMVCGNVATRVSAVNPEGHSYGEWQTITAKTCLTDGEKSRTCSLCQKVDVAVDESVGHVFGEAVVDKKVTTKTCGVCGYSEAVKVVKGGTEKTLTAINGALKLTGVSANKNYSFEIGALDMETEAYYKQYIADLHKGYTYRVLDNGVEVAPNADMTLTLSVGAELEDYEIIVERMVGNARNQITNIERKDGKIVISGSDLIGSNMLLIRKGAEREMNLLVPIIVTVATLAIAGVAIYFFLVKGKKKEQLF